MIPRGRLPFLRAGLEFVEKRGAARARESDRPQSFRLTSNQTDLVWQR